MQGIRKLIDPLFLTIKAKSKCVVYHMAFVGGSEVIELQVCFQGSLKTAQLAALDSWIIFLNNNEKLEIQFSLRNDFFKYLMKIISDILVLYFYYKFFT